MSGDQTPGTLTEEQVMSVVDAALLAADGPLTVDRFVKLFGAGELPEDARAAIRAALDALEAGTEGRGYELKRVASGFRYQVRQELSPWVSRLWEEKPPRYSRALLETLALVAYRQPVTRGDIEQVRGVSVSQNIMRTLLERGWVRVVGVREVPGRPAMYGTTKAFLDYFNLKSLSELPPLEEIKTLIEPMVVEEEVDAPDTAASEGSAESAAVISLTEPEISVSVEVGEVEIGAEATNLDAETDSEVADAETEVADADSEVAAVDSEVAAVDSEVAAVDSEVTAVDSEAADVDAQGPAAEALADETLDAPIEVRLPDEVPDEVGAEASEADSEAAAGDERPTAEVVPLPTSHR